MTRPLMLAGALALATLSFAPVWADPSNPAASPVSPSLGAANQPTRTRVPSSVQPDTPADPAERTPAATEEPAPANTDAADRARQEAAKPKVARTVRMGERTIDASVIASR